MARRIVFLSLALVSSVALLWWLHLRGETAPWRPALSSRAIATRMLADHLAHRYPGAKALVIGNPFTQRSGQSVEIYAFDKAELQGLREGFNSAGAVKEVYPELRPEFFKQPDSVFVDPKTTTPLSFLVADDAFDRLIRANPNVELIVSLIGLPANVRQARWWQDAAKLRVALLLPDWRMVGSHDEVRQAIKMEKIAAAVISRPGSASEEEVTSRDYKSEFDRRYILVTKDNIDELLHAFPQLF